jgi:hypothetical protein
LSCFSLFSLSLLTPFLGLLSSWTIFPSANIAAGKTCGWWLMRRCVHLCFLWCLRICACVCVCVFVCACANAYVYVSVCMCLCVCVCA